MIRRLHYAHVDGQSSQSSPAFYTPAYYPLSRTFLPHFLYRFLPVVTPASRASALPILPKPDRSGNQNIKTKIKSFFAFYTCFRTAISHIQIRTLYVTRFRTFALRILYDSVRP